MLYVKANKALLQSLVSEYETLNADIDNVMSQIAQFRGNATTESNGWTEAYYSKFVVSPNKNHYYDENNQFNSYGYNLAVQNANRSAREAVQRYVSSYHSKLSELPDLTVASNKVNNVKVSLSDVSQLIEAFEGITSLNELNLSKVMESLEDLGSNYSIETITVDVDGEQQEVQVLMWTDENGNKYNVSELINAFYTYTGATGSNAVVLASKGLNGADLDQELTNMVNATALGVDNQLQRGFYSVASQSGIEAMYEDATGKEYDSSTVTSEYSSLLGQNNIDDEEYNKQLSGVTNASALGGMAMFGALMAGLGFGLETPKQEPTVPPSNSGGTGGGTSSNGGTPSGGSPSDTSGISGEGTVTPIKPVKPDEEEGEEKPKDPENQDEDKDKDPNEDNKDDEEKDDDNEDDDNNDDNEDNDEDEDNDDDDDDEDNDDGDDEPEQPPREVSDEEAEKILKDIEDISDDEPLEEVTKDNRTVEDIDAQARDQYYADKDKVIEYRVENYEKYNNMTLEEKISALEDVGYDHDTAIALASDNDKGQTAYIVGMDEKELARISNEIAKNEGISELEHDTKYDDGHDLAYVEDGTINVEMNPVSENVQKAREELTVAKNDYDESVTIANNAINKANTAKGDYENVLNAIKQESGDDPKYWTKAQVEEYNKATTNYNNAVTEANNAKTAVTEKQAVYEREKEEYQIAYDEHIKETKSILDAIGDNNTTPGESDNNDSPIDTTNPTFDENGNMVIGTASETGNSSNEVL